MNMITRIEPIEDLPKRRFRDLPLWQRASAVVLPLVAIGVGVGVFNRESPAIAAPPPPTVTVATPLARDLTQWDDHVGRFEASKSVEVRPRVSGAVTAVHFTDGAIVQKGQLLFTIDPRPYAAALAEARASVASAASDLSLAQANLDRANRLVAEDAVSKSDLDQLGARVRAATGVGIDGHGVRPRAHGARGGAGGRRGAAGQSSRRARHAPWRRSPAARSGSWP